MSLAPGVVFNGSSQMTVTAGAGQAPTLISGGVGLMADGSLALDTNVPSSGFFNDGIAINTSGAFHGTTTPAGTDVYAAGVRVSALGQIVYEPTAAVSVFSSGNPISANDRLATP